MKLNFCCINKTSRFLSLFSQLIQCKLPSTDTDWFSLTWQISYIQYCWINLIYDFKEIHIQNIIIIMRSRHCIISMHFPTNWFTQTLICIHFTEKVLLIFACIPKWNIGSKWHHRRYITTNLNNLHTVVVYFGIHNISLLHFLK